MKDRELLLMVAEGVLRKARADLSNTQRALSQDAVADAEAWLVRLGRLIAEVRAAPTPDWRNDPLENTKPVKRGAIRHSCITCGSVWYADRLEHCPRCDGEQTDLLRVTHDPKCGLAYIYIAGPIPKGGSVRQLRASADIILDLDADGHLIGIELLSDALLHPALKAIATLPKGKVSDA